MKIKILAVLISSVFFFAITGVQAFGATTKCKVITVDDSTVTLDCGDNADNLEKGMDVKVKAAKKRKTIEGC